MQIHKNIRQIFSFCIVGAVNTIIDFTVLNILLFSLGGEGSARFAIYKSFSFIFAATNSYFLNKRFTFSYQENSVRIFSKFLLISTFSLIINVGVSSLIFIALSDIHFASGIIISNISATFGTIIALTANFLGYKFFVFKKRDKSA